VRVLKPDERGKGKRAEKVGLVAGRAAAGVRDTRAVAIEKFLELPNVGLPVAELQIVREVKGCRVSRRDGRCPTGNGCRRRASWDCGRLSLAVAPAFWREGEGNAPAGRQHGSICGHCRSHRRTSPDSCAEGGAGGSSCCLREQGAGQ